MVCNDSRNFGVPSAGSDRMQRIASDEQKARSLQAEEEELIRTREQSDVKFACSLSLDEEGGVPSDGVESCHGGYDVVTGLDFLKLPSLPSGV